MTLNALNMNAACLDTDPTCPVCVVPAQKPDTRAKRQRAWIEARPGQGFLVVVKTDDLPAAPDGWHWRAHDTDAVWDAWPLPGPAPL